MKHKMRLAQAPFEMIRNGEKTIELRLYDERRRMIKAGDIIVFTNTEDDSLTVEAGVIELYIFDSFKELYENLPLLECGYTEEDVADASPDDMDIYYSKEEQAEHGVVGIKIALL